MSQPQPIYTAGNCQFAYQLRWGITLFWRQPVAESQWLGRLRQALEQDHIRILSSRWLDTYATQFAVSTTPPIQPALIIQRVKGRLQYAVRELEPKALRPHYSIRSYGTQERKVIENYIAKQPSKHPMADPRVQQVIEDLVFVDPTVDLSAPQKTTHGQWWHNLHLAFVHLERWRDVDRERLLETRQMVLRCAKKKSWRLSRCAILADHLHVSVGCHLDDSPQDVALALMNNLAWVYEMKPVLCYSAFVGTFGEYDQRAVRGEPLA